MGERRYERSPVPGVADLWPGELPFTAWGQFGPGSIDLRVFDQDTYWVDIECRPQLLATMSPQYVAAVVNHLERNVRSYYRQRMRFEVLGLFGDLLTGKASGDLVAHSLGVPGLTDLTPTNWLEGTPLMRGLRRRLSHPF